MKPTAEYDPARIEEMARILERAGAYRIDRAALGAELTELIAWTGLAVENTDKARLWDELTSEEQIQRFASALVHAGEDPMQRMTCS